MLGRPERVEAARLERLGERIGPHRVVGEKHRCAEFHAGLLPHAVQLARGCCKRGGIMAASAASGESKTASRVGAATASSRITSLATPVLAVSQGAAALVAVPSGHGGREVGNAGASVKLAPPGWMIRTCRRSGGASAGAPLGASCSIAVAPSSATDAPVCI